MTPATMTKHHDRLVALDQLSNPDAPLGHRFLCQYPDADDEAQDETVLEAAATFGFHPRDLEVLPGCLLPSDTLWKEWTFRSTGFRVFVRLGAVRRSA